MEVNAFYLLWAYSSTSSCSWPTVLLLSIRFPLILQLSLYTLSRFFMVVTFSSFVSVNSENTTYEPILTRPSYMISRCCTISSADTFTLFIKLYLLVFRFIFLKKLISTLFSLYFRFYILWRFFLTDETAIKCIKEFSCFCCSLNNFIFLPQVRWDTN